MESHQEEYHHRAPSQQNKNKTTPDGSPSTSVLKPRPNTLSPTKRPRNLRVALENVDYRKACYTSDLFSIELALARMSHSQCRNLLKPPPAYDSTGTKIDQKLTVLRSLINHHLLHCQHCRDQMEDLEYFKPQPLQRKESPADVARVTIEDFNLSGQEMSRLWAEQEKYIDLLESRLGMSKVIKKKKVIAKSDSVRISKPLDASDKQQNHSLLKRKTYVIGKSDSVVTIPIKKSRGSDNRDAETINNDPLEIIESKIPGHIERGDKDDRKEKEVKIIDKDIKIKEELFSSIKEKEISEPEPDKVKPESTSSTSTSSLKLKSFSELAGATEPSEPSATGRHSWTMTEGDTPETPETPESVSVPLISSEVAADTFVPALGGAVTPIAPGTKVMSSKVLRLTDTQTGLPSGVYSLVKPDRTKAVVIVKKTEVRGEVVARKKSVYKSPINIYIGDMRKQLRNIFTKSGKEAPTEDQVVKIAMKRWAKMNDEQKQFYKRLSEPIEEPQGISLPKTAKQLMPDDPNLPQGWSRNLQQVYNKSSKSFDVGVCIVTADKVRLFNTAGLKKYLAKHPYTDIDPDSISFSPYQQSKNSHQEPASTETYNSWKSAGIIKLSVKALEQADPVHCDTEDPLALDESTEENKNAEDSGQDLDLFSSVSSLEEIYGNIDTQD